MCNSFFNKHLKNHTIKTLILLSLVIFTSFACESDPILSPNAVDETEKGSYGLSSFPDSTTNRDANQIQNPELF